jgi:hypothetical protein
MSAYTSIRNAAQAMVGFLAGVVKERFRNIDLIEKVRCPVFFIHGLADSLIPSE